MGGAFTVVPLAAFLFGHAALVSFLAKESFLAEDFFLFFYLFERFGRSVIDESFAGNGCADSFFEKLYDFNVSHVGILGNGDVEMVADLKSSGGFERFLRTLDFTGLAGFGCKGAGLVEADRPQPFIDAATFGHWLKLKS